MIIPKKSIRCFLLALALFVSGMMIAGEALAVDWFNEDWHYRRQITIDHTKVQDVADPSTTYADFPLLVFATGLSDINANGTDIRFTASDGTTELPRQIESYSSGILYAWVKVTLTKDSSDSSNDMIYMYYGNPGATEPAPSSTYGSENVWDSNYVGVWHLSERVTDEVTSANAHTDSSGNSNNGTQNGNDETSGAIYNGQDFDGNDYIDLGSDSSLQAGASNLTVTAWVKSPGHTGTRRLISSKLTGIASNAGYSIMVDFQGNNGYYGGRISNGTTNFNTGIWISNIINNWVYVAIVIDRTSDTIQFYGNGIAIGSPTSISGNISNSANPRLAVEDISGTYLSGSIDEARISNTSRTAEWIETSYNNQDDPSDFLTVSEQVSIPTMTEWGMIIFMVLAGLGGIYYLRRQGIES